MSDDFAGQKQAFEERMARFGLEFVEQKPGDRKIPDDMLKQFLYDYERQHADPSLLLVALTGKASMSARTVEELRLMLNDPSFAPTGMTNSPGEMASLGLQLVEQGEALATAAAQHFGVNDWQIFEVESGSENVDMVRSRQLTWQGDPRVEVIRGIESALPELRAKGHLSEDELANGVTLQKSRDRDALREALKALRLLYGNVGDEVNRQAVEKEYEPMLLEALKVRLT